MPKIKRPTLARYVMSGFSPNHDFPYHVVGKLEDRYYTVAMTEEEAQKLYAKLGEDLAKNGHIVT